MYGQFTREIHDKPAKRGFAIAPAGDVALDEGRQV